jgi:hypothetical protein
MIFKLIKINYWRKIFLKGQKGTNKLTIDFFFRNILFTADLIKMNVKVLIAL